MRNNLFYIVFFIIVLTSGLNSVFCQEKQPNIIAKPIAKPIAKQNNNKPIIAKIDTKDSIIVKKDSLKPKKSGLEAIVKRKAVDYEKIDQKTKIVTLYNKAELYYQDIELKAGIIVLDYSKDEVYAGRIKDSSGKFTQYPKFKQGSNEVEPDSIRYNFKTKKALVWNSRTKQGELNVLAEISKKENDSVYFMKNAKLTTAADIDNPEYYFLARTAKFVPGKKVVVGITNMYIADVPTPIGLPFAFFPMTTKAQSGVIIPTFQDTGARGYSLQNGGYYFTLTDNYDLTVLGDYYTNGSYALRFETAYAKRYSFSGNLNFRFENQITSERGFPDYAKRREYNFQWSHQRDGKANPNSRFSAQVNLGSSTYFRNSLNITNNTSQLNNTLGSSISYNKTFNTIPMVNMSVTATHQQIINTKQINLSLPTFFASVDKIFPFAGKSGEKKGLIKNINLEYSVKASNEIQTTDSLFFKPQMFKDLRSGVQHTIPLNTNFKVFKHFSVSTGASYNEVWYFKTIEKKYNAFTEKVETTQNNGFDAFRTYGLNASTGTTIYGTFNFGKNSRIKTIRHKIAPSLGYNYAPDFSNYQKTYQINAAGKVEKYTRFDQGIYGGPQGANSSILSFGIVNNFEAKIVDRDTTKTDLKKIVLLSNLSFTSGYNLNTKQFDVVNMNGTTAFFKDKMQVNFGASLDPYGLDNAGNKIEKFNINNNGSLFRLVGANLNIGYSISSNKEDSNKKTTNKQGLRNGGREDDLFGKSTDLSDRRQSQFEQEKDKKESESSSFYKNDMPWDLTFAYSVQYGNTRRENAISSNSIMINGNLQLSPKWKFGASSGYDLVQKGVSYTQLRFERDLLSWRMDFNWSPIGDNKQWGFFIGIKAGVLSDIKWDKRKVPDTIIK